MRLLPHVGKINDGGQQAGFMAAGLREQGVNAAQHLGSLRFDRRTAVFCRLAGQMHYAAMADDAAELRIG